MQTSPRASLTGWQRAAAAGVEGGYVLLYLLLRLADCLPLLWLWQDSGAATAPLTMPRQLALCAIAGAWLLQALLLPPLRLGREIWYYRLAANPAQTPPLRVLFAGFRRFGDAIGWRWRFWWQRTTFLTLGFIPTALIWGYGSMAGGSILWLCAGCLPWFMALLLAGVWQCRYAATPLLLADGWGAAAAMQLSVRLMRRKRGAYINLWGTHFACPLMRRFAQTTFLLELHKTTITDSADQPKGNACFLRPSLL